MKTIVALALLSYSVLLTAGASSVYGPVRFMGDIEMGAWNAISNITSGTTSGGVYTNGPTTNYYRLAGTNAAGRLPYSTNVVVEFVGATGTNACLLTWTHYGGLDGYVIERSLDAGATWTNWVSVGPTLTNWTDTGTNAWATNGPISDLCGEIPPPQSLLPAMATNATLLVISGTNMGLVQLAPACFSWDGTNLTVTVATAGLIQGNGSVSSPVSGTAAMSNAVSKANAALERDGGVAENLTVKTSFQTMSTLADDWIVYFVGGEPGIGWGLKKGATVYLGIRTNDSALYAPFGIYSPGATNVESSASVLNVGGNDVRYPQIGTVSPTGHTHTASAVTNLLAALLASGVATNYATTTNAYGWFSYTNGILSLGTNVTGVTLPASAIVDPPWLTRGTQVRYQAGTTANKEIYVSASATGITSTIVGTGITLAIPTNCVLNSVRMRWPGTDGTTVTLNLGTNDMLNAALASRWGCTFACYREDTGAFLPAAATKLDNANHSQVIIQGLDSAQINHIVLGF